MKKLYILIMIFASVAGKAQIVYVNENNSTGVEDGTAQHPFNTVEEGLLNCIKSDTLFIAAGEYFPDSLKINQNITIEGAGKENTLVHGTFILSGALDSVPVQISSLYCQNVIQSDSTYTYTPLTVMNCRLDMVNDSVPGVVSTGSLAYLNNEITRDLKIQNSSCQASRKISGCSVGGNIDINIISMRKDITVSNCQAGGSIRISTVSKKDTIYIDNNIMGDSLKILSVSTQPNIVKNNEIGTGVEIFAVASSGNTFQNNLIKKGILSLTSTAMSNTVIGDNTFENGGIKIKASAAQAEITNNTIYSDGTVPGIHFISTSGGKISGNQIELPAMASAGKPLPGDSTTICAIKVESISFQGIFRNTIKGGEYGISLMAIASNMANNTITNSGNGVYLQTVSCRVDSCRITDCLGDGLIVGLRPEHSDYAEANDTINVPVNYNVISNNGGNGVRLFNNARLKNNTLTGNGGYDLYIETPSLVKPEIFAQNNIWDHDSVEEINQLDIYDGNDNNLLAIADILPFIEHPGIPELISPENFAPNQSTVPLDFSWKNDFRADAFDFELATDSLFTHVIFSNEYTTDTMLSVSEPLTENNYFWRVRSLRLGFQSEWSETWRFSTTPAVGISEHKNEEAGLVSCYPNPFDNKTKITYYLAEPGQICIQIFDATGRLISIPEKGFKPAGKHQFELDTSGHGAKFFVCRLVAGNKVFTAKLIRY